MFGATEPDLRNRTEEGKVWFDELASVFGSGAAGWGIALAKRAGKADLRDFGGGSRLCFAQPLQEPYQRG